MEAVRVATAHRYWNKPIVIFGAGWHGKTILDICKALGALVSWFIDDNADGIVDGVTIRMGRRDISNPTFVAVHDFVVGVGEPLARQIITEELVKNGATLAPPLIHPSAVVGSNCDIGRGTVVMGQALIGAGVRIGRCVVVNNGATVAHDCEIDDYASVNDGCHLGGSVHVEVGAYLGVGVSVKPKVKIGALSIIGVGAAVVFDIPAGQTAYGVPARWMER